MTRKALVNALAALVPLMAWALPAAPVVIGAEQSVEEPSAERAAEEVFNASGVQGGLIVHLGCGDGRVTAALGDREGVLVHGLDADPDNVEAARRHVQSIGLYGKVSIDRLDGAWLPYVENLANLVVAEDLGPVTMDEVMRVLSPGGVACIATGGRWTTTVKPRPDTIDDWTHYLHDASNNAVAHDSVVGPPRRMQWLGSPRYARHHDRMSSVSAVVSDGGRVFTIFDETSPASILSPPDWKLIARDAFNGTILWKRPIEKWHTHLWPLKSGPAQLPRRLVAAGERVYVTLSLDGPLAALDAATGETLFTIEGTAAAEEVISCDGLVLALVKPQEDVVTDGSDRFGRGYNTKVWDETPRRIVAAGADDGEILWNNERTVLPGTLAADSHRVVFHDGAGIVCLDRSKGTELWRSEPVARAEEIRGFYLPTLVLYDDVVLFSGGETAGLQTGSWYESGKDTLTALSAETGEILWSGYHPPSGYRSPEDLLVAGGLVWTGETTSGRAVGEFTGRDPHTGEVKSRFAPDLDTYWFHHRCYRGKATDNYLLMARAGTEFIDFEREHWITNHWVRGACLYGVMPANGLLYAPQHPCACYLESKLYGFNALAPAGAKERAERIEESKSTRLQRGPAYATLPSPASGRGAGGEGTSTTSSASIAALPGESSRPHPAATPPPSPDQPSVGARRGDEWPTYRHDPARSGRTTASVPATLAEAWQTDLGGKLTSPVIAAGKVFLASTDTHTVHALDAATGRRLWQFTAGGRIDSPPTIYSFVVPPSGGSANGDVRSTGLSAGLPPEGGTTNCLCLFGSADGCVYCLRASDGAMAWRFRAAPMDQRLTAFEQVESVWPVPGSVLVEDGVAYCVAGRSMFLDGGLRLLRLDPASGELLSETVLDAHDPQAGDDPEDFVSWLNMPPALPDVLSSDGRLVYMRSQPFRLDGSRLPLEAMPSGPDADKGAPPAVQRAETAHLFCPTGLLDDTWWHRTYWMYGSTFVSGWCGYFLAGKTAPAGRILVFDEDTAYGFGRKPKYFRWTTPIEHHLFAADKLPPGASPQESQGEKSGEAKPAPGYLVRLHWTEDLPLLARAMVLADGTLFLAGPPDLIDEEQALKKIGDPQTQAALAEQAAAFEGKRGGVLCAVRAADGEKLAELDLDAPPVFDGLAAASGRLYLTTERGTVVCLQGR